MSRLPYDYSRCPVMVVCGKEKTCLRRTVIKTDPPRRDYSYTVFPGGPDGCSAFIEDKSV